MLKKSAIEDEENAAPDSNYQAIKAEGKSNDLAFTSCPSGIGYTFLSARSLQKVATCKGIKLKAEIQRVNNIINRFIAKDVTNTRYKTRLNTGILCFRQDAT